MNRYGFLLLMFPFLLLCSVRQLSADDSGTFRGKWWNYYDRAIESAETRGWDSAVTDLAKAIAMRERDQRMARTYGMHFIDYFPHRELGIAYLELGRIREAINELEESLRQEESAKAVFYLNRARKNYLGQRPERVTPPVITVEAPLSGTAVKGLSVILRGRVSGDGFVSGLRINNEAYRIDLAKKELKFEQEIQLGDGENRIVITCSDLLGNDSRTEVLLNVDREAPGIMVSDIKEELRAGEQFVRIRGIVHDDGGLRTVVVGDQKHQPGGEGAFAFDVAIRRKSAGEQFVIKAADMLGNENEALLDLEKELLAFGRKPEPVLLAFNAPGILSFDKEPPVLKLKEAAELPTVYVDRYYIEGEAFDNKVIEKVLINGTAVSTGKGKKVFFSKMVKLQEGQNRIKVEAVDGSGNRASQELLVRREIPTVMQTAARLSLTVMPFDSRQKRSEYAELAFDQLVGAFVDQKRFSVIERARLEAVLQEQKLTKAKLTDPEHSLRIGRLMAANAIVATSIKEDQKSIEVIARVINAETSEVMEVKDVFTEEKGLGVVRELMDGLAAKIAGSFPMAEGMVIKKDGATLYTDMGNKAHIRKDAPIVVFRKGKEIKHPVTGKSLGFDTVKLGEGRIEDLQEDFSKAKILDRPSPQEIREKDLIVTK